MQRFTAVTQNLANGQITDPHHTHRHRLNHCADCCQRTHGSPLAKAVTVKDALADEKAAKDVYAKTIGRLKLTK